jgi:hypothetical protein
MDQLYFLYGQFSYVDFDTVKIYTIIFYTAVFIQLKNFKSLFYGSKFILRSLHTVIGFIVSQAVLWQSHVKFEQLRLRIYKSELELLELEPEPY